MKILHSIFIKFKNDKISQIYKSNYDNKPVNLLLVEIKYYVCIKNIKSLLN